MNRFEAPTMLFGSSGFADSADSLRSLCGSESQVTRRLQRGPSTIVGIVMSSVSNDFVKHYRARRGRANLRTTIHLVTLRPKRYLKVTKPPTGVVLKAFRSWGFLFGIDMKVDLLLPLSGKRIGTKVVVGS